MSFSIAIRRLLRWTPHACNRTGRACYCFRVPSRYSDVEAAPLLCAGLIGYRALKDDRKRKTGGNLRFRRCRPYRRANIAPSEADAVRTYPPGRYNCAGFCPNTRCGLGRGSDEAPLMELGAAVIFAPVGALVPAALKAICPGGTVVCGGIHMSEIPVFSYDILWREKRLVSVANLTREDAKEFLDLAPKVPINVTTESFLLNRQILLSEGSGKENSQVQPCSSRIPSFRPPDTRYPSNAQTSFTRAWVIVAVRRTGIALTWKPASLV